MLFFQIAIVILFALAVSDLIVGVSNDAVNFLNSSVGSRVAPRHVIMLVASLGMLAVVLQLLLLLTRVNILKIIVLVGTFALAMAFAANDLVNFIGVPLAGLAAFTVAGATADPLTATMEALREPVRSNTGFLLIAGLIMVATLWISRKARSVTRTEVSLGRQEEGFERFESTGLSRSIVRLVSALLENTGRLLPNGVRRWAGGRFDRSAIRPVPGADGKMPSFDLIRAGVNLMVASALISLATSLKLPLSTTYVTFMVAMGSSLSDQAWGRDSAVYRVSGVLTVIGGWFFTAMMAFTVSSIFAAIIYFGRGGAMVGIALLTALLIFRTHRVHRKREAEEQSVEVFNLRKIKDSAAATAVTVDHMGTFLREVRRVLNQGFDGLFEKNRQTLKSAREGQRRVQLWSNIIAANVFKVFRLSRWEDVERTQRYAATISSLQEISESMRDIVVRAHLHVANNHSGLLAEQIAELDQIRSALVEILDHTSRALRSKEEPDQKAIASGNRALRMLVNEFDQNQIMRIQANRSKTRLSILFYSLVWDSLKIAEQTTHLFEVFDESLRVDEPEKEAAAENQPVGAPEPA